VELYGINNGDFFGNSIPDTKRIINDLGMSISSTHTGSGLFPEDTNAPEWDFWKKITGYLNTLDAGWAVASSLPLKPVTMDDLKSICAHFNRVGEVCKKGGVKFAFHNHHEVFGKIENEIELDYLIKNTDPNLVFFQLDMGHTVRGGGDCARYLRDFPKRIPMWHASDFDRASEKYTWLGKGSVPYPTLFDLAKSSGLEVLTVEQETEVDTLTACKSDFDYIKQFKWTKA
jgi:sugar phosphate isomerase/epimerase